MLSARKLELLAPAKNLLVGIAAIDHGADAVYIGAPDFGARKQAANNLADIEQLINYAHIYRSKVYIALNTILFEKELEPVQKLIKQLHEIGADALIIQDMGILEMDLPPIPIHASTQANNFTLEQVQFFEKIGLSRVVLARELSIAEIQHISSNTSIELEAFIHGALCVSLSGQCYLSQAIGGRSANRGECAQACRLEYSLINAENKILLKNKHLLSLKDYSAAEKIEQLAKAGITSFKIEGRLKDADYVKNVTAYYRLLIDDLLERDNKFQKASSGKIYPAFQPDVNKSFNRQFTNYFLDGRVGQMASQHSPKSFGELVGTVIECKNKHLKLETQQRFANGDGLCYLDENQQLNGVRVEKIEEGFLLVSDAIKAKKGTLVYRNHDHLFLKQLENSTNIRKTNCFVEIYEENGKIIIKASDEDSNSVILDFPVAIELAKNQELIANMLQKQFLGISDSYFKITDFQLNVNSDLGFYRMAEVNQIRRKLLEMLLVERIRNYVHEKRQFVPIDIPFFKTDLDYRFNVSNSLAVKFYARHEANVIENAPELTENYLNKDLMTTRYCIKYELGICESKQLKKPNPANNTLFIQNKFGKYLLEFDCSKCLMKVKQISK